MNAYSNPRKFPVPWNENLKAWYPYILIIIVGFMLYFPTLFFKFTYLDDNPLILDNQIFLKNLSNILVAFKEGLFAIHPSAAIYYRPILTISFMLDAQLSGVNPIIYHFSNIIFHLIASSLVYLFLCRLGYKKELSFIFALIFTIHPVLTQAVAWIPGRNDVLLTIFVLSSFIFLINFLNKGRWYQALLHLLFFTLAFFTKESALVLILMGAIYLGLIKPGKVTASNLIILGTGWSLIWFGWFLLRKFASLYSIELSFILKLIIINSPAIIIYIGKLLLPFNLSVLPIIQDSTKIYGFLTIIILIIFLYRTKEKRYNFIIFGLAWFLLFLLPSFIRPNTKVVADFIEHRVYLPMVGFIILLLETDFIKNLNIKKRINQLIIILILLILSLITLSHSENFRNGLNFWQNAVKHSPHSALAHVGLGDMYCLDGLLDKAEAELRTSLALTSQLTGAHDRLGFIYMAKNMPKEAEEEYKKELKINPFSDRSYYNLGVIYDKQGNFKEAEKLWKKTLEINPNYDKACFNLSCLYYEQGRVKEAGKLWEKTLEINPDFIDAYYNLIIYYHKQNDESKVKYYIEQLNKRGVNLTPEFLERLNVN